MNPDVQNMGQAKKASLECKVPSGLAGRVIKKLKELKALLG